MRRREFIHALSGAMGAAMAWPFAVEAQPTTKSERIGILVAEPSQPVESMREELNRLGYIEGKNLQLEYRFAAGQDDRYPELAKELVALACSTACRRTASICSG